MIIFLDESGDLGFDFIGKEPSEKFVITLLVCKDRHAVLKFKSAVRRTLKNKLNQKKNTRRVVNELKGSETNTNIKRYFYQHIPKNDWELYTIALNKRRVYETVKSSKAKNKLYNFLSHYVLSKIDFSQVVSDVTLIIDRSKSKSSIAEFNNYLDNQLQALLPINIQLNIYHQISHVNPGLQAVDFFSWGIYRTYEYKDLDWYNYFKDKITFEEEYLGQK